MKLNQIAASDPITKDLLNRVLTHSPLLSNHVEFYIKPGDSATSRKEQDGLGVKSRSLDNKYAEQVTKPAYETAGRKFIGDTIRLDVARERMGFDLSSELLGQVRRLAPGIANKFHDTLINGDVKSDSEEFNGLKTLVVGKQKEKLSTNGMPILMGNDNNAKKSHQRFLEHFDMVIGKCVGTNKVAIMNGKVLSRINSIAREYIQWTKNDFGVMIPSYGEVTLLGIDKGGADIMGFDETVGTSSDCSSIYVTSFEEEAGLSFLTTQEGFKVYEKQKVGNYYEHMVELILDSILLRDEAISKLEGIKLS